VSLRLIVVAALFVVSLAAGCRPAAQQAEQLTPLPTQAPAPTLDRAGLLEAEGVARSFLHYWQEGDYDSMYALTSFRSRQATSPEAFRRLYENTHTEMRLASLSTNILAQAQESGRVMNFVYEATFDTNLVGRFSEQDRVLRLVVDDEDGQWRVAWSPADIFAEMGTGGQLRLRTFPPNRANIYTSDGTILADMNGRIITISIIRRDIPHLETCIGTLAQVLQTTAQQLQGRISNFGMEQLAEIGIIEPPVFEQWQTQLEQDCDAHFDHRPIRRYIYGDLFSHIIGHVGYPEEDEVPAVRAFGFQQDSIIGRSGIEASWDSTLRGSPGSQLVIVSPDGVQLRLLAERVSQPAQSVYLTIDEQLQRVTLQAISDAYAGAAEAWAPGSAGAAAIVMDVNTGAILSMVSYPTFDANAFNAFPVMGQQRAQAVVQTVQNDPRRPQLNRATQGRYPTGSVMKAMTSMAAADSGVYALNEAYTCTGGWNRDIFRRDWLAGGHGRITLPQGITMSCNPYFYEAGYHLNQADPDILPAYASRAGFGRLTGLTDVQESAGFIGTPQWVRNTFGWEWTFSDAVNLAVGQGYVEITPLQIVRFFAAIANGGTLYRPQLVDRAGLLDEFSYRMEPDPMENLGVADDVMETVRAGLCEVTTAPYGTATHIFRDSPLQEIGICAKTGTAENPPQRLPHAWFVAYAPREEPEIAIVVIVENSGDGSAVAAPITRRILEYYFFER
jgi:penicillin-binding protein 2